MGFVGADISELRELSAVLRRNAEKLEADVVGTISVGVRVNPWTGPDAQHFREMWTRQTSRQIRSVASQLREAADVLNRNAAEQDSASSAERGTESHVVASGRSDAPVGHQSPASGSHADAGNGLAWLQVLDNVVSEAKDAVNKGAMTASSAATGIAMAIGKFSPRVAKGLEGAGQFRKVDDIPLLQRAIMRLDLKNYTATRAVGSTAAMKGARGLSEVSDALGKAGKVIGPVATVISFVTEATKQYQADAANSESMDAGTRIVRSGLKASVVTGAGAVGMKVGAAIGASAGAAIGGPVGAVIGGSAGALIGGGAISGASGWATDLLLKVFAPKQ